MTIETILILAAVFIAVVVGGVYILLPVKDFSTDARGGTPNDGDPGRREHGRRDR